VQVLSLVLLAQAGLYYTLGHGEKTPPRQPLDAFPKQLDGWRLTSETPITAEVQAVLRADDTLGRTYETAGGAPGLHLFVAFFGSQRSGVAPHSPKNCLPGSGWAPVSSGTIPVQLPGLDGPTEINRYIVARESSLSVVYYWYQTHRRVIASEYWAKIYLVLDAIRDNRSDTALVRVTVPVRAGEESLADRQALSFIRSAFPALRRVLPQ
jgi:EpsI family protein